MPEETLNVLITVMSEGELHVPRLGSVAAAPGFRLVAAMNPFDAIGTARISSTVYDRVCRVAIGYQDARRGDRDRRPPRRAQPDAWLGKVVEVVRRTRAHAGPAPRLVGTRRDRHGQGRPPRSPRSAGSRRPTASPGSMPRFVALSGRVRVPRRRDRTAEEIVTELWAAVFATRTRPTRERRSPHGATTAG